MLHLRGDLPEAVPLFWDENSNPCSGGWGVFSHVRFPIQTSFALKSLISLGLVFLSPSQLSVWLTQASSPDQVTSVCRLSCVPGLLGGGGVCVSQQCPLPAAPPAFPTRPPTSLGTVTSIWQRLPKQAQCSYPWIACFQFKLERKSVRCVKKALVRERWMQEGFES